MDFSEFRHTIEHYLVKANPNFDLSSLDLNNVFEAYVSDVTPREYIASMKKSINESVAVSDQYEKYYNRTVSLIKKSGYTIQSMPRELDEDISDFYDNGYTTAECANYLLEKIEKNTVKLKEPTTIRNVELKNKLLRLMHDVEQKLENGELGRNEHAADKIMSELGVVLDDSFIPAEMLDPDLLAYMMENSDHNIVLFIFNY